MKRVHDLLVGRSGTKNPRRWIAPAVAAVGSAAVIWFVLPHVPWYFKAALALLAFAYIGAQSAAYLAADDSDDPPATQSRQD
jgi:hypothetical protein